VEEPKHPELTTLVGSLSDLLREIDRIGVDEGQQPVQPEEFEVPPPVADEELEARAWKYAEQMSKAYVPAMSPLPILSAEIAQRLVEAAEIYTADGTPDTQPPDAEPLEDLLGRLKVWHPGPEELAAEATEAQLAASPVLPFDTQASTAHAGARIATEDLDGDELTPVDDDVDVEETLAAVLEEAERGGGDIRRRGAQTPTASDTDRTAGLSSSDPYSRGQMAVRLDATASERDPDEGASEVAVDEYDEPPAFVESLFHGDALAAVASLQSLAADPATISHQMWASASEEDGMISDLSADG
jgi:hypothetical protein